MQPKIKAWSIFVFVLLVCFSPGTKELRAEKLEDFSPAVYQIEAEYVGNDFAIVQFRLNVLAHFSYLLISDKKILVVDPGRDINTYLEYAAKRNLEWVGTFLTQVHADFIGGHREMAQATGAPVYASHKSGNLFPHIAVREGERIEVGNALLEIVETPGHTIDSICGVVSGKNRPEKGLYLFSGDTVLAGCMGLPDLSQNNRSAAELAAMMLESWNKKLANLKPNILLLPTHGAGAVFGVEPADQPCSTIASERKTNTYFKLANNRAAFLSKTLEGLKEPPASFKEIARLNKIGPTLVDWKNPLTRKILTLNGMIQNPDVFIVDVRDGQAYREKHINGAINIGLRGNFERWVARIVPFHARLILQGSEEEMRLAARRLKRVGYIADYLDAGQDFTSRKSREISAEELYKSMQKGQGPLIIDVRKAREIAGSRIGPLLHIPLAELPKAVKSMLYKDEDIVIVCDSAYCSNIAFGILERAGFNQHKILAGGTQGWQQAGLPFLDSEKEIAVRQTLNETSNPVLPKRISSQSLLKLIKAFPDSCEIIDIRPAKQVADYNPLNAKQVDLSELLESDKWLMGQKPLIIIDRDGILAMIAGGIIAQKTNRQIKILTGGLEAFWQAMATEKLKVQTSRQNTELQVGNSTPQGEVAPVNDKQKKGQVTDHE